MKTSITILLILFSFNAQARGAAPCEITKVIDGDTVAIFETFNGLSFSVRLANIDTPETGKKAKCAKEAELGERAKAFTVKAVKNSKLIVCEFIKHDKFGGRIIGNIYIDENDLSEMLIFNGLAREYHGEKKGSWCK